MADVDMQHPAPRFALVGCTNFVVSLVAFYLCYHYLPLDRIAAALYLPVAGQAGEAVGAEGAVANVLAYFAGMLNSFWLNRWWAFRATDGGIVGQGVRFVIVNAVSLILGTVIMFVLVDRLHFPELAVWLPLAGLITVTNYLGFRLWAFARPEVPDVVVRRA
ncbi:MAG TPA: GtrA family protein [Gammaproteobacteria bacterium]|jgi:putative flippase GtrA|nr:GtrA family protein [Gammaproteobacteria bacterium]